MNPSRHTNLIKWTAVLGACAAVAATSAQAGGPPADPGWAGLPHCTVPKIEGTLLTSARTKLHGSCVEAWRRFGSLRRRRGTPS